MKAVSLVSAIVFLAITISAIGLIYTTGMPIIERMQEAAAVEGMKNSFVELDKLIQRVASEGNGSRRIVDMEIDIGRIAVDPTQDTVLWGLETENPIVSARSAQNLGNLVFGSNLETSLTEATYKGNAAYALENEHLIVYVGEIGSAEGPVAYSTEDLVMGIFLKDSSEWAPLESVSISLDGEVSSMTGNGYTIPRMLGPNQPYGEVKAYMNSSYADYVITITLESGADFITIEGELQ
jgi:archaellum component FlaF (FlaF/FlaG flagellin family)